MVDNTMEPLKDGVAADKPKLAGVMDQLLRALSDKVLNMETAVRENTVQVQLMANSMELVRGIPDKMQAVEQRVVAGSKAMSEMRERLDGLEVSVFKSIDGSNRLVGPIQSLQDDLHQHTTLFEKPLHKSVRYQHVIGKAVWIVAGLILLCAGLVGLCVYYYGEAGRYAASDIQWRAAQLITDSTTLRELQTLKEGYAANPDSVRRDVIAEEDRRAALAERIIERDEKNKEVDDLKKQRKQR